MFDPLNLLMLVIAVIAAIVVVRQSTCVVTTEWSLTETGEGATGINKSVSATHTGEALISYTMEVPAATVDEENNVDLVMADVKCLIITTDRDVTLKVNSSSAATDTIALKATVPFVWQRDSGVPVPITGTAGVVSKFFLSNAHVSAVATVKVRGVKAT